MWLAVGMMRDAEETIIRDDMMLVTSTLNFTSFAL
jgi:hypothetical protein